MRLEQVISKLLYTHDCVIVPDFGAFITNRISSYLRKEDQMLYPAQKLISFNPLLKNNDGVLLNYLIENESFNYHIAEKTIAEKVSYWKEHLAQGKELILENLGTFHTSENSKLEFFPVKNNNFLTESFGLSPLRISPVLVSVKSKTSWNIGWAAASLIPIIIGGYLYFQTPKPIANFVNLQLSGFVNPISSEKIETKTKEAKVVSVPKEIEANENIDLPVYDTIKPMAVSTKVENNTTDVKENKVVEAKKEEKPEFILPENAAKFLVIAGSFKKKEEALQMKSDLEKAAFKEVGVLYKKGRFYYVSFKSFDQKEKAESYKRSLYDKYPQTWVLTN